jgi:hypothetical protein
MTENEITQGGTDDVNDGSIAGINEIVADLARLRKACTEKAADYKERLAKEIEAVNAKYIKDLEELERLEESRDMAQEALLSAMESSALDQWKAHGLTISRKKSLRIKVTDKDALMRSLVESGHKNLIVASYDESGVEALQKSMLQKTGEILPGVEAAFKQFISIREAAASVADKYSPAINNPKKP